MGVSVVIPAFNYGHFVSGAIESALAQDYPHREVIVVDDGSTDNTREIVEGYAGHGVKLVSKKNAGLSAARNTGADHARFPFLTFLDADDELRPGMMRRCMDAFAQLSKEYAVVGFHVLYADVSGMPIATKERNIKLPREVTVRDLLIKTRFPPAAMVKKSALLECGGFDTGLTSSEDRDFWLRVAATHRIHLLPDQLLLLRQHAGSMRRNADRMSTNTRRVLRKAFARKLISRGDLITWLRTVSFNCFETALMYFDERRFARGLANFAVSIVMWPFFHDFRTLEMPAFFRARAFVRLALDTVLKHE